MNTLAELKRRLQPGVRFACENHLRPHVSGERTVVKAQTNGFWYTYPEAPAGKGFTTYPKVADLRFYGDDRVSFLKSGEPAFTYTVESTKANAPSLPGEVIFDKVIGR